MIKITRVKKMSKFNEERIALSPTPENPPSQGHVRMYVTFHLSNSTRTSDGVSIPLVRTGHHEKQFLKYYAAQESHLNHG